VQNFVVATCPPEVWTSLRKRCVVWDDFVLSFSHARFTLQCRPDRYSCRNKFVPQSGWFTPQQFQPSEENYYLERLTWLESTNLPSFTHEFWFLVKWISTNGVLFRAQIKTLSLCYDSFLNHIKCDVEYDTEFFADSGRWNLI
jgi:hypothetical protein